MWKISHPPVRFNTQKPWWPVVSFPSPLGFGRPCQNPRQRAPKACLIAKKRDNLAGNPVFFHGFPQKIKMIKKFLLI